MSLAVQTQLPGIDLPRREPSAGQLLQIALEKESGIEIIERITAMMERERDYQNNVGFDEALNRCQQKMERISADANNPQTHSRYATYAKLDKVLRPIYTAEGFSLSFGEEDCPVPGKTRFVAHLSRSGITRTYRKDLTASTKGPKGNDVMTPIHAEGAADSYARRYLLKGIFNVAIGEDDDDGNGTGKAPRTMPEEKLQECLDAIKEAPEAYYLKTWLDAHKAAGDDQQAHLDIDVCGVRNAPTAPIMKDIYGRAFTKWEKADDTEALKLLADAKNKRREEF